MICCFVLAIGKCCARSLSLIRPVSWAGLGIPKNSLKSIPTGVPNASQTRANCQAERSRGYYAKRLWPIIAVALLAVVFKGKATA